MNNISLNRARRQKDDEYYTKYETVNELSFLIHELRQHRIYCNCDTSDSAFVRWFNDHDIPIYHHAGDYTYRLDDFDCIVTNPPFSPLKEFMDAVKDKELCLIIPINSIVYKNVLPYIASGRYKLFSMHNKTFDRPDGSEVKLGNVCWLTTFDVPRVPYKRTGVMYNPEIHLRFENYDAIYISKSTEIPDDYYGEMAVPMNFIVDIDREEFEIIPKSTKTSITDSPLGAVALS